MSDIKASKHTGGYYVCEAVVIAVLLFVSRVIGIFYARAATDILYIETILPSVLYYARMGLQSLSFGTAIAAFVTAWSLWGKRSGRQSLFVAAALFFADAVCAFLIDVIGGTVRGSDIILAATSGSLSYLWTLFLAVLAYFAAVRCLKRRKAPRAQPCRT